MYIMFVAAATILNVLAIAPSSDSLTTSCNYINGLNGICQSLNDCPFYSSNLTDHTDHFPPEVSTCSKGEICCPNSNLKLIPTPPTCGFDLTNLMSNGYRTSYYNYRFVVLLQYQLKSPPQTKNFHCGGTLINNQYVLTAAHCVKSPNIFIKWDLIKIRLGEWNLNEDPDCVYPNSCADKFVERSVSEVKIHEKYKQLKNFIVNDIMLIRLAAPVEYTDFIKPLCLPIFGSPRRSNTFQIVGWGRTSFNGPLSNYKQAGVVSLVNPEICAPAIGLSTNELNNSIICTKEILYGGKMTSPCFGDSGGPLLQATLSKYDSVPYLFLSGIISTGDAHCNSSVIPTLHTNVFFYLNWVIQNIRA